MSEAGVGASTGIPYDSYSINSADDKKSLSCCCFYSLFSSSLVKNLSKSPSRSNLLLSLLLSFSKKQLFFPHVSIRNPFHIFRNNITIYRFGYSLWKSFSAHMHVYV